MKKNIIILILLVICIIETIYLIRANKKPTVNEVFEEIINEYNYNANTTNILSMQQMGI